MQMRLVRTRKDPTFVHVILVILEMALTAQVYALHAFNINFAPGIVDILRFVKLNIYFC